MNKTDHGDGFLEGTAPPRVLQAHAMSFLYTSCTDYVCFLAWVLTNKIQIMSAAGAGGDRKEERKTV